MVGLEALKFTLSVFLVCLQAVRSHHARPRRHRVGLAHVGRPWPPWLGYILAGLADVPAYGCCPLLGRRRAVVPFSLLRRDPTQSLPSSRWGATLLRPSHLSHLHLFTIAHVPPRQHVSNQPGLCGLHGIIAAAAMRARCTVTWPYPCCHLAHEWHYAWPYLAC